MGASPTEGSSERMPRWSRRSRRRALNPETGVRLPVAVLRCQVVERKDVRLLPGRRGFEPLPGSATLGGRGFRRAAADRETRVRVPPGRPSQPRGRRSTARMSVRHAEDAGSSPAGHTDTSDTEAEPDEEGGDMPTNINDKLISWASEIDERDHPPGREDGSPADRRGSRRAHARRARRHRRDRRLGDPDDGRGDPVGGRRRHRLRHDRRRARRHRGPAARHARAAARSHRAGDPRRCRPGSRPRSARNADALARRAHAGDRARGRPGDQGREAVRHARFGEPLLRALRRRARPRVGGAALGQPWHRQPARHDAHRHGTQPGEGSRAAARGPGPRVLRRGHAGVRRRTSPTCSGRRSTHGPTATR